MKIPSKIRAGDTVVWRDEATVDVFGGPINGSTHNVTYYLRTSHNHQGAAVAGVAVPGSPSGSGWTFTISSATSAGFVADDWYWQALAVSIADGSKTTLGAGQIEVLPSLAFVGTPGAFDGRTQTQKDLEACQAAIRSLMSGGAVQEYRIGTRSLKRYDLAELLALESRLKAQVARENKAAMIANGLGNPHNLFVRFGR